MHQAVARLQRYYRQHLAARILSAFAVVALATLAVAVMSLIGVLALNGRVEATVQRAHQAMDHVTDLRLAAEREYSTVIALQHADTASERTAMVNALHASRALYAESLAGAAETLDAGVWSSHLQAARTLEADLSAAMLPLTTTPGAASPADVAMANQRYHALTDALEAFGEALDDSHAADLQALSGRSSVTSAVGLLFVLVSSVSTFMLAIYLTSSITRPIRQLAQAASGLRDSNLELRVTVRGEDEVATLATVIGEMVADLQQSRRSVEAALHDTQRRNRELQALNAIAAAAAMADPEALQLRVIDIVMDLTGESIAGILLRQPDGRLQATFQRGLPEQLQNHDAMETLASALENYVLAAGLAWRAFVRESEEPAELLTLLRGAGINSGIAIALISQGSVCGVLTIGSRGDRRFSQDEVRLLTSIGQQIGVVLDNASLMEQRNNRIKQLAILNQVSQVISGVLDLDRVYSVIHEQVGRALEMPTFTIALWDEERNALYPVLSCVDNIRQDLSGGWPTQPRMSMAVVRERRPILTNDYYLTAHEYGFTDVPVEDPYVRRSWIGVPMQIRERLIGIVVVATPYRHLDRSDVEMLVSIANQAAVAIENGRLYQRTRELGVVEERNRLAREIHDTIAQGLTGVVLQLEATDALLESRPERAKGRLTKATELARATLGEARRSVWNLRPKPLEERTLYDAVQAEAKRLEEEQLVVHCSLDGYQTSIPPEVENGVYRIAQEALQNIRRHAQATTVHVGLAFEADQLTLTIQDDGRGFDPEKLSGQRADGGGFGLVGMRERARLFRGELTIRSAPGAGAELVVTAPLTSGPVIPRPAQPASAESSPARLP